MPFEHYICQLCGYAFAGHNTDAHKHYLECPVRRAEALKRLPQNSSEK